MNKTLHFCWLLDAWRPSREQYLRAWQAAGWDCVLWSGVLTESPVAGVELRNPDEIVVGSKSESCYRYEAEHKNHATCADLFRYELLLRHGGAYADIDVLPGVAAKPELLLPQHKPLFGSTFMQLDWHYEIRFVVAPGAEHPLFELLRDTAVRNCLNFRLRGGYAQNGIDNLIFRTGPRMAEDVIHTYVKMLGQPSYFFLLHQATNDDTDANCKEHFTDKFPVMRSIAGLPAEDEPLWRCA